MSGFSDAWCSHCNMRIQSSEGFRLRRLCFWCEQKKNDQVGRRKYSPCTCGALPFAPPERHSVFCPKGKNVGDLDF